MPMIPSKPVKSWGKAIKFSIGPVYNQSIIIKIYLYGLNTGFFFRKLGIHSMPDQQFALFAIILSNFIQL